MNKCKIKERENIPLNYHLNKVILNEERVITMKLIKIEYSDLHKGNYLVFHSAKRINDFI